MGVVERTRQDLHASAGNDVLATDVLAASAASVFQDGSGLWWTAHCDELRPATEVEAQLQQQLAALQQIAQREFGSAPRARRPPYYKH